MKNEKKNSSGYNDPTAYNALLHISKEERADRNAEDFIRVIKKLSKAYRVELIDRIKFKDLPTGRIYK